MNDFGSVLCGVSMNNMVDNSLENVKGLKYIIPILYNAQHRFQTALDDLHDGVRTINFNKVVHSFPSACAERAASIASRNVSA